MENGRDVGDVIVNLMKIIPENEENLRHEVAVFYNTLWNQAPELRRSSMFWKPLGEILNSHIYVIDQPWKKTLLETFNNN
jgi:hypothetical protein